MRRRRSSGNTVSALLSATLQSLLLLCILLLVPFQVFPAARLADSSIQTTERARSDQDVPLVINPAPQGGSVTEVIPTADSGQAASSMTPAALPDVPDVPDVAAPAQQPLPVQASYHDSALSSVTHALDSYQASAPAASPEAAAPANAAPIAIEPQPGYYSPNTFIEWRGDELWFIRAPFQSRLVPRGDGSFAFEQGWLTGRLTYFTHNEAGGINIMLLADDGTWHVFARSGEAYPDLHPTLRQNFSNILDATVADDNVPGALLYVALPGQGVWMGARGVSNRALGIPMVPHDRIRIASVTKPFVATVILQLASEGVLTLNDPVSKWMPGAVPNGNNITIRHLLNHTSGIYNYLDDGFVDRVLADRARIWQPQEMLSHAVSHPAYFSPGEPGRWRYSNTNYIVLGMIVEHATGVSLAQQIRWRILEPVGMHHTYFDPDDGISGGVVRGYVGNRDYTDINLSFAWAAGGMVSTVEDMGLFSQALFGGRLLNRAAMDAMHEFVSVDGSWGTRNLVYGMGLMQDYMGVAPDIHGQPRPAGQAMVRGHTGGLTGYRTAMWYMPENGAIIVAAVNQMYYDPNKMVTLTMDSILEHNDVLRMAGTR
jgi:D-alanyl-D-alanine carboxypeptidase